MAHVGHAAAAIAMGKCQVALVTLAGRPRSEKLGARSGRNFDNTPEGGFEEVFGGTLAGLYAMAARRHMYEYGTTSEQLAEVKVAASLHAQHNPHALLRKPLTAADVLNSPLISDPLHTYDCCVITDGGGAFVRRHDAHVCGRRWAQSLTSLHPAARSAPGDDATKHRRCLGPVFLARRSVGGVLRRHSGARTCSGC